MPNNKTIGNKMKEISKEQKKKERFLRSRMWFSTFMSAFFPDRGDIPDNIGNNLFIGNNMYVTKNSITKFMYIEEMTESIPVGYQGEVIKLVKQTLKDVQVDFIIKNIEYKPDLSSGGLNTRISQWERVLDNEEAHESQKRRCARLMYTVDVAKRREVLFKSHIYIRVRAKDTLTWKTALEIIDSYFSEYESYVVELKSDLETHLKYTALLCNERQPKMRDIPYIVNSALTLAESLPTIQGVNDSKGSILGLDEINKSPYVVDFRSTAAGKGIYVTSPAGGGKTALVLGWCLDFFVNNYNVCIMDLKGNEFSGFTKACGGVTLSMRPDSTYYVNTFRVKKTNVEDPTTYFNEQLKLSKMQLEIICNFTGDKETKANSLIDDFLKAVYNKLGVLPSNPNTWIRSEGLNPYSIFVEFQKYLSNDIKRVYADIADDMVGSLRMFMSKEGSNSHMYRDEFNLEDIIRNNVVTFDFGVLNSSRVLDERTFKIKFLFMKLVNDEFTRYKKSLGEWTFKVLEESQIAEDFVLKIYQEEFTLRRAQNQVTALLGNSVSSLVDNPISKAIMDNISILCIGPVHRESREYLIREFGLESHRDILENVVTDTAYEHTFLCVNQMQKGATHPLLKMHVPKEVLQGKIFKGVDIEDEEK